MSGLTPQSLPVQEVFKSNNLGLPVNSKLSESQCFMLYMLKKEL